MIGAHLGKQPSGFWPGQAQHDSMSLHQLTSFQELKKCLSHEERMIGSPMAISYRSLKILEALGKAKHVRSRGLLEGYIGEDVMRKLCLVEGRITGHCYDPLRPSAHHQDPSRPSSLPMWEWLHRVRTGQDPIASFYFPDNLAGPDILFALKGDARRNSRHENIILCIIQVSLPSILLLQMCSDCDVFYS